MPAPDRERLIEELLARYRTVLEKRLPHASQTLHQIEETVEEISQEMDHELEHRILERQDPSPENHARCPKCLSPARYRRTYPRQVLTRHGERTVRCRYYHCSACRHGFAPLEAALQLGASPFSPQVRAWAARLAAHLPFPEAADILRELCSLSVSASSVERIAVGVGRDMRQAQLETTVRHLAGNLPQPERKPPRLYISMDGTMTPLRDPWKKDGSAGTLICRWGECKTAVVYEARSTPEGDQGVVRRAYTATFGDASAFAPQVGTLAHECGHHWAKELVVLADGAGWIWGICHSQFPTATQIVDFFHASEHLWRVANTQFGAETEAAKAWVSARQEELLGDRVKQVLDAIKAWQPQSQEARQLQASESHYFANNDERMRYGTFRKRGYHIGSGVMEAACKHVVGQRLDQAGMHWRPETAEAIVALRAALLSSAPPNLLRYCGCA